MSQIFTDLDNLKITKANPLIEMQVVETATKMKVQDQRLILAVISQISPEDESFQDYEFSIRELRAITGISEENLYRDISAICDRLISNVITLHEPQNKDGFLKVTWFSHAEYIPSKPCVRFSFSPRLKPYLLQLKNNFTTYSLKQVIKLRSIYSFRMYELSRQFLPLKIVAQGKKTAFRVVDLASLKMFLGVGSKYPKYSDIRRYVLEAAQHELKEKTDIQFDFEPIKQGRRIHAIKLTIHNNIPETAKTKKTSKALAAKVSAPDTASVDPFIHSVIKMTIPTIADNQATLLAVMHPQELLFAALRELSMTPDVKDPERYLNGILRNIKQQPSTKELTSRDWVGKYDFGIDLDDV